MPRPALFVLFVSLLIAPAAARALNLDRIANGECSVRPVRNTLREVVAGLP